MGPTIGLFKILASKIFRINDNQVISSSNSKIKKIIENLLSLLLFYSKT